MRSPAEPTQAAEPNPTPRAAQAVAAAMGRTNRGVLRLEFCKSLGESLSRLMSSRADEVAISEWREYCGGASAAEWWDAYAAAYGHAARWASRKAAHAPFCFELMVAGSGDRRRHT